MAYKFKRGYYQVNANVKVILHWDNLTQAGYTLKFENANGPHWEKVKTVIDFIKATIPSSQREYDPETKTWFIGEKFFTNLKLVLQAIQVFELDLLEKPEQVAAQKFHSKEADYERFKQLLDLAHIPFSDTIDISTATKSYRRAALVFHPDRNPAMSQTMSELNEIWARLKTNYFKETVSI